MGILAAGAGYIPINVNQPLSRRERIYSKSDIKFAITDTRLKKELEWPETVTVLDVMEADAYEPLNTIENYPDSNTAYVIFTSVQTHLLIILTKQKKNSKIIPEYIMRIWI